MTVGAGVAARDRGPCVWGRNGAGAVAGRKSPPSLLPSWQGFRKVLFQPVTDRATELGRAGGWRLGGGAGCPGREPSLAQGCKRRKTGQDSGRLLSAGGGGIRDWGPLLRESPASCGNSWAAPTRGLPLLLLLSGRLSFWPEAPAPPLLRPELREPS